MIGSNYYLKNINDAKLKSQGFKYLTYDDVYVLRFPIDKHKGITVMEGKLVIHADTGKVMVDVYTENGEFYSQYYNPTNPGFNTYLDFIHEEIYKRLKMYGIREKKKEGVKNEKVKSKEINRHGSNPHKRK